MYLEHAGDDEHVFPRERDLLGAGVQRVPELPEGPGPRRPAEYPPREGPLVVQEHQHVLEGRRGPMKGDDGMTFCVRTHSLWRVNRSLGELYPVL